MIRILASFMLFILLSSCGAPKRKHSSFIGQLKGEGSSFGLPISSTLFPIFTKNSSINIDYKSDSSYNGIDAIIRGDVDFALSLVPLSPAQRTANPDILHIPISAGSLNFAYNITNEGFSLYDEPIHMTPDVLAKIYNKQITKWNDPAIIAIEKEIFPTSTRKFPNLEIQTIGRSIPSGDTYILTQFLSKATKIWLKTPTNIIQTDLSNNPLAIDVMRELVVTSGGLAYTTMAYGVQNNIPLIRVRNNRGVYGRGCTFRTKAALSSFTPSTNNIVDLIYPLDSQEASVAPTLVYILVRKNQNYNNRTLQQAQQTVDFIGWLLTSGQRLFDPLYFINLTPSFRQASLKTLHTVQYDNQPLEPNLIKEKK